MTSRWGIGGSLGGSVGYRPDIDVLRGVAVLLVVLFHVSPVRFPGGFVGVDVFFVISGYLITGLLVGREGGGVSRLRGFWLRRMRRLFPALTIALALALGLGLVAFNSFELSRLGLYAVSAATFSTNVLALSELGYFESGAVRPLLHLWSLAVEEQFYVLWPVILIVVRGSARRRVAVAGGLLLASLAFCVWMTPRNPELAFFLPFTRFWELLLGALLALGEPAVVGRLAAIHRTALRVGGSLLIAVSFVAMTDATAFPGWAALIPCLGAALFILGGSGAGVSQFVAPGAKVLRWVGLISYPLYLYHYILLAFLKRGTDSESRLVQAVAAVGLSVVLAWATHRWVERPLRSGRRLLQWGGLATRTEVRLSRHAALGAVSLLAMGGCGAVAWRDVYRTPVGDATVDLEWVANGFGRRDLWDTRCFITKPWQDASYFERGGCIDEGEPGDTRILLVGDSHAGSLAPGIRSWIDARGDGIAFSQITAGWCEPTWDERYSTSVECLSINRRTSDAIGTLRPDVVVLHAWWPRIVDSASEIGADVADEVGALIERWRALGAQKVVLVGPVPFAAESLPEILLAEVQADLGGVPTRAQYVDPRALSLDVELRTLVESELDGVVYVSPIGVMCDGTDCLARVGDDIRRDLVFWDYGHLTIRAATWLVPRLFGEVLAKQ